MLRVRIQSLVAVLSTLCVSSCVRPSADNEGSTESETTQSASQGTDASETTEASGGGDGDGDEATGGGDGDGDGGGGDGDGDTGDGDGDIGDGDGDGDAWPDDPPPYVDDFPFGSCEPSVGRHLPIPLTPGVAPVGDVVAPEILAVRRVSQNEIELQFTEAMDDPSGVDPAVFAITLRVLYDAYYYDPEYNYQTHALPSGMRLDEHDPARIVLAFDAPPMAPAACFESRPRNDDAYQGGYERVPVLHHASGTPGIRDLAGNLLLSFATWGDVGISPPEQTPSPLTDPGVAFDGCRQWPEGPRIEAARFADPRRLELTFSQDMANVCDLSPEIVELLFVSHIEGECEFDLDGDPGGYFKSFDFNTFGPALDDNSTAITVTHLANDPNDPRVVLARLSGPLWDSCAGLGQPEPWDESGCDYLPNTGAPAKTLTGFAVNYIGSPHEPDAELLGANGRPAAPSILHSPTYLSPEAPLVFGCWDGTTEP